MFKIIQFGTESADVVTGISVDDSDSEIYPDLVVAGYTEGSLAGLNGERMSYCGPPWIGNYCSPSDLRVVHCILDARSRRGQEASSACTAASSVDLRTDPWRQHVQSGGNCGHLKSVGVWPEKEGEEEVPYSDPDLDETDQVSA